MANALFMRLVEYDIDQRITGWKQTLLEGPHLFVLCKLLADDFMGKSMTHVLFAD